MPQAGKMFSFSNLLFLSKPELIKSMQIKALHSWDLSYSQAAELQKRLAGEVQFTALKKTPKLIAGLDCAFSKDGQRIIATAVLLKRLDFAPIETVHAVRKTDFPYIPGLLSFREAPVCIAAVRKLKTEPDVFIIDGQGIAHPRRLGLAAHLGLFFDKPTIGCAKSRLTGNFEEPSLEKGAYSPLKDKQEIVGAVVRTRTNVKPVFVSVGNKCLLKEAIEITLGCTTKYRLPEPTRLAHHLAGKSKLKI
jgi:deoxyribonuclease V